ncbi:MAG: hypothetical protein LBI77_00940 [Puniceicoccales bacterium]|jgi:hypothetical protein|nr:hypothetical protein [Puniceicoccales bacterium]
MEVKSYDSFFDPKLTDALEKFKSENKGNDCNREFKFKIKNGTQCTFKANKNFDGEIYYTLSRESNLSEVPLEKRKIKSFSFFNFFKNLFNGQKKPMKKYLNEDTQSPLQNFSPETPVQTSTILKDQSNKKVADEQVMKELAEHIPSLQDMQKLRQDHLESVSKLEKEMIASLGNNSFDKKKINDYKDQISKINSQKQKVMQEARKTLEQAKKNTLTKEQLTGKNESGQETTYAADQVKKILETNIAFNEIGVAVESFRARQLLETMDMIEKNPKISPEQLGIIMGEKEAVANELFATLMGELNKKRKGEGDVAYYQELLLATQKAGLNQSNGEQG